MKTKIFAVITALVLIGSLSGCMAADNSPNASSGGDSGSISEYPAAQDSITSGESSGSEQSSSQESSGDALSSLGEAISSANSANSTGNSSSKPASSSQTSSKPQSSSSTSSAGGSSGSDSSKLPSDLRGVWYAFLEFSSTKTMSEASYTATIRSRFQNLKSKGYNTVFVQVRPYGDAMYRSSYFPWSYYASGAVGKNPGYDPLTIVCTIAKQVGLSVHAWINPYRTMTDAQYASVSSSYKTKQWYTASNRSDYMIKIGDYWWLQPGNKEVQQLIQNGAQEIVNNYNVDGIHIDDYFYNTSPSTYGDTTAEAKANTTAMVKGLYTVAHSKGKLFGVSPAGGFAGSSVPDSDNKALSTNLNLWCKQNGYIDYVMPQIYWSRTDSRAFARFETVLSKWNKFVTASGVKLYVGLAPYKAEMNDEEINAQIALVKKYQKSTGYVMFRYDSIANRNFEM